MKRPEEDELKAWVQHHRPAFDTLEPRADLWAALERQLPPVGDIPLPRAPLTATRGGRFEVRPTWWQLASAAVVVFCLGYGLRLGTERADVTQPASVAFSNTPAAINTPDGTSESEPVTIVRHGFTSQESEPAMQAAVLTSNETSSEASATTADNHAPAPAVSQRLSKLEARYDALLAYHQRAERTHTTPARAPLADDWDREMALLDSGYVALRHELARNPNTDEVVDAMTRNLHLRLALLNQQARALDAVQQTRHRPSRAIPRRPPSVNPDAPASPDDVPGGWYTPTPPPPAPALDTPTRTHGGHGAAAAAPPRWVAV